MKFGLRTYNCKRSDPISFSTYQNAIRLNKALTPKHPFCYYRYTLIE